MTPSVAELAKHPDMLNKDTVFALREMVARYPYYQAARILFLKTSFCSMMSRLVENSGKPPSSLATDVCSSIWLKVTTISYTQTGPHKKR